MEEKEREKDVRKSKGDDYDPQSLLPPHRVRPNACVRHFARAEPQPSDLISIWPSHMTYTLSPDKSYSSVHAHVLVAGEPIVTIYMAVILLLKTYMSCQFPSGRAGRRAFPRDHSFGTVFASASVGHLLSSTISTETDPVCAARCATAETTGG